MRSRPTLPLTGGLIAILGLAACGPDADAPRPAVVAADAANATDGLPAEAGGLVLDGRVIPFDRDLPAGPRAISRALDNAIDGRWGDDFAWGEQVAQMVVLPPPAGFDSLLACVAMRERRQTLGFAAPSFTTAVVYGLLHTPAAGAGSGPVWGYTKDGVIRGSGRQHRLVAWDGQHHVTLGWLRGTQHDILAALASEVKPWQALATRFRRAVERGADLRQMGDDLAVLRNAPADARQGIDALLAERVGQLDTTVAQLPAVGDPLAASAHLSEAARLHSDAGQLAAAAVVARAIAWRESLASAAEQRAVGAPPASASRAGWLLLAWRARGLQPSLAGAATPPEVTVIAVRDFLARVAATSATALDTPAAKAMDLTGVPVAQPLAANMGIPDFTALTASERDERLFQPYTLVNPQHAVWEADLAQAQATAAAGAEAIRAANARALALADYETKVETTHMNADLTDKHVVTTYEVDQAKKQAHADAERRVAALEQAQAPLDARVEAVRAAEPLRRSPQRGDYSVSWREWRGTAVLPAGITRRSGAALDLTVRLAVQEGDRRTAGLSVPGMLPEEAVPAQDGWRTRAQVEAALAPRLRDAARAALTTALRAETAAAATAGADADESAWAAWLLGSPSSAPATAGAPPSDLLPPP